MKYPFRTIILSLITAMIFIVAMSKKATKPIVKVPKPPIQTVEPELESPPLPQPVKQKITPSFVDFPAVKKPESSLGPILSDIESHMDYRYARGNYRDSDKITHGHETTHGISSSLRQMYQKQGKINGFYVLNNKAVIVSEPPVTLSAVARVVPVSLRGMAYNLYLIKQARYWENEPLYILDEMNAYTNGSEVGLNVRSSRSESILQMLEFNVYAFCLANIIRQNYDDHQFKAFLIWETERVMQVYKNSKNTPMASGSHDQYLNKLRTSSDAEPLRQFIRGYCGEEWTKEVLGF